jgi:hypothetical protein
MHFTGLPENILFCQSCTLCKCTRNRPKTQTPPAHLSFLGTESKVYYSLFIICQPRPLLKVQFCNGDAEQARQLPKKKVVVVGCDSSRQRNERAGISTNLILCLIGLCLLQLAVMHTTISNAPATKTVSQKRE